MSKYWKPLKEIKQEHKLRSSLDTVKDHSDCCAEWMKGILEMESEKLVSGNNSIPGDRENHGLI